MAGAITVHFSKEERAELRRRWKEQGFTNMSAFVRTKLGLEPDGGIDPITEYDDLDSSRLLDSHIALRDRVDGMNTLLKQMARSMGVRVDFLDTPRQYTRVKPVDPPDEDGNVDIPNDVQLATTVMPVGFERG